MVRDIRIADLVMAKEDRFLLRGEVLNREVFGKSVIAKEKLSKGTIVKKEMIEVKGPGKGLSPSYMNDLIGMQIKRDIGQGEMFLESDLDTLPTNIEVIKRIDFKSQWGLISRFSDFHEMIAFDPDVIEIHLAEHDLKQKFSLEKQYPQALVVHAAEYMDGKLMDLCSGSEEIRKASVDLVNQTTKRAAELGAYFIGTPKVIAHPGAMSLNTKLDKNKLKTALLTSLEEIDTQGTDLLLENLPPYPWYFGGAWKGNFFMDANEIADFCRETGINIVFDNSHAALYCNAKESDLCQFVQTVKPYIRHIHMADAYGVDGEGMQIHEGDIDFDRIMPLLSDYRDSWVPEVWQGHLNNGQGFLTALERLARYKF
jgi:endonuclease IV